MARLLAHGTRLLGLLFVVACAKEPATPAVTVSITSPAEGDTIVGSAVNITLGVSGIELAPVAEARPGTAHHHLYLDADLPSLENPIPMGVPGVIHLGKAQTSFHWDSVLPGTHRIIAVLADPGHVPLKPLVADTIHIVVVPFPDSTFRK